GTVVGYRQIPWLERFTTENTLQHFAPYAGLTYELGRLNRRLGRDRPFTRAGAMATGFATGLYFRTAHQGYFEARAGMTDGQTHIDDLPSAHGRKYAAAHQGHHDQPSDPMQG